MELTYTLSQKDFYDSLVAHRERSTVLKWSIRLLFTCTLLLPVFGLVVVIIDRQARLLSVAPLFGLVAFWAIFIWGAPWWSSRVQFQQQPAVQGSKTMTLDGSGIHWQWRGGQADVEWTNFIRFLESKTVFLLYTSPVCFNIVPKRALTPGETDSFRRLLQEKLGATMSANRKRISPRLITFLLVVAVSLVLLLMAIRNIH